MSGTSLNIQSAELDQLIGDVIALDQGIRSEELRQAAGDSMRETIRNHFYALANDSTHHESSQALGANRTGFYLDAADKTHEAVLEGGEGVSVSVEQEGLAQRYFGGTINARPGSFLTIPARAEAYGKTADRFSFLKLIMFPSGLAALVDKNSPAHEGTVYYWLVRSVTQAADPTVLPKDEEILDPVIKDVRAFLDRIWGE